MEATRNQAEALAAGGKRLPPTLFVDPFIDLRQSVMAFGMNCESGLRIAIIEDPAGNYSFTIRVSFVVVQNRAPLSSDDYPHLQK